MWPHIVWRVEREVTLADGTVTRALVPQGYVRVHPGGLDAGCVGQIRDQSKMGRILDGPQLSDKGPLTGTHGPLWRSHHFPGG